MKKALLALMLGCSIAVSAQTTETKPEEKKEKTAPENLRNRLDTNFVTRHFCIW